MLLTSPRGYLPYNHPLLRSVPYSPNGLGAQLAPQNPENHGYQNQSPPCALDKYFP